MHPHVQVLAAGSGGLHISSFADRSLASGLFLGHLLAAVRPAALNADLLTPGDTPRDCELNAKYVISTARKLGCFLFLVRLLLPAMQALEARWIRCSIGEGL